jgi:hypothetical protein
VLALVNAEAANAGGFLWPSIADALDTFLRRKSGGAEPFERIWRLIHVWEAVEITLASVAMARIRDRFPDSVELRRQREFFWGKCWDPVTESFLERTGAGDGSIDQWINILDEVSKADALDDQFILALRALLTTSGMEVGPLLDAWGKTCDVPADFWAKEAVEVRVAMRHINSFRNRFAHVPFPHDPLAEVCDALEGLTEQLFRLSPSPTAHEKAGQSSALTGGLLVGDRFFHGTSHQAVPVTSALAEPVFIFPCCQASIEYGWRAAGFIHVDPMMRIHVLTRVKDSDESEFTRFRAEANAVVVLSGLGVRAVLPEPQRSEFVTPPSAEDETAQTEVQGQLDLASALEAIREGDYDKGIEFFSKVVTERPRYHVGWLRLGHARREKAVRIAATDPEAAKELLSHAVHDLDKATEHVDQNYQATAHYERSKAFHRLALLDPEDPEYRARALEEASRACELSSESRFASWKDYLDAQRSGVDYMSK